MKQDSPKPPVAWEATLARELYERGHTPSEVVGELQRRGVVGDIKFISIARAAWGLGLGDLKFTEGWKSGHGVGDRNAFDAYIANLIRLRAEGRGRRGKPFR